MKYFVLCLVLILGGCGTIVNGSSTNITFKSIPSGAIAISDGKQCVTPCTLNVSRRTESVEFRKEGFQPRTEKIDYFFSLWSYWSYPIIIVDYMTGGMWKLPENINTLLEPSNEQGKTELASLYKLPESRAESMYENIRDVPSFGKAKRDNDVAVVIGIENYKNVPNSRFSKNDAVLMKAYLVALGYKERNIYSITDGDATKSAIETALEAWLPNHISANSNVFVYYSGHGSPDPADGNSYLVPSDANPTYIKTTGYPVGRMYKQLASLDVAKVVVVLDSCFSGSGERSVIAKGVRPLVMQKANETVPASIVVMSATQSSQISSSLPEVEHGIFTYYLLKEIKKGNLDIANIFSNIKPLIEDEAKRQNAEQSPTVTPNLAALHGKNIL